jgi:uncharacterized alkaline shock family protein YloU
MTGSSSGPGQQRATLSPYQVEWTEADRISAAVLSCPDVVGMSAGAFGEVRSYLPGRSVPGVTVDDDVVAVHVVARFGPPLDAVVEQITAAVSPLLGGRRVHVTVEDIVLPGAEADSDRAERTGRQDA